jgi:hypothetical protein
MKLFVIFIYFIFNIVNSLNLLKFKSHLKMTNKKSKELELDISQTLEETLKRKE